MNRKPEYAVRYLPADGWTEWRLYTADLKIFLTGGICPTRASATRDAKQAIRVRMEYPESFAHEKAVA